MKIACVCQGGHVRSVALKYLLTYKYGHEAIACGWESNSEESRKMLFTWADYIVIMEGKFIKYIPKEFHDYNERRKLYCYDVGEDKFGNPFHPNLQNTLVKMIEDHGLFSKK